MSIVNAKWIFDIDQAIAVTLPERSVAGPERLVQVQPTALLAETIYPMSAIPDEWKISDNGQPAQNWVAAIHRSRATSRDDDRSCATANFNRPRSRTTLRRDR